MAHICRESIVDYLKMCIAIIDGGVPVGRVQIVFNRFITGYAGLMAVEWV